MRWRRFLRSTLKWGCTASMVVIAVSWIASLWYAVCWWSPSRHEYLCLNKGRIAWIHFPVVMAGEHFVVSRQQFEMRWSLDVSWAGPSGSYRRLGVPLWWILLPTAVPAV